MKRRIAVLAVSVGLLGTGVALAAPSGVSRIVLAKGTLPENVTINVEGPIEVTHRITTWEPGGTSGWASWPGPGTLVVTLKVGPLTYQNESEADCAEQTLEAGNTFVIPGGSVFRATNNGKGTAEVHWVAFLPEGATAQEESTPADCTD